MNTSSDGTLYLEARAFSSDVILQIEPFGEQREHRDALTSGLEAINRYELLTDSDGQAPDGIGAVNRKAGRGFVPVDPGIARLLDRALNYCFWSDQAHGPLGGNLYGLWGLRQPVYAFPSPGTLADQVELAACGRLKVDSQSAQVELAEGSRLELWGFAKGAAVDAAIAALRKAGTASGWVQIGTVMRAFGAGPGMSGWPASANPTQDPLNEERVLLVDQAMAIAGHGETMFDVSGEIFAPYIHQARGRPTSQTTGTLAVLAVTELAVDAQALATCLFVMPPREGQYKLGVLKPEPSVLWMQGQGEGRPLLEERGWARLEKW